MELDAKLIGETIQECRKKTGLSQEVLSGLAGLDRTHYSKIERGERVPTIVTLFKLAHAMGVLPSDIMKAIESKVGYSL